MRKSFSSTKKGQEVPKEEEENLIDRLKILTPALHPTSFSFSWFALAGGWSYLFTFHQRRWRTSTGLFRAGRLAFSVGWADSEEADGDANNKKNVRDKNPEMESFSGTTEILTSQFLGAKSINFPGFNLKMNQKSLKSKIEISHYLWTVFHSVIYSIITGGYHPSTFLGF